MAMRIPFHAPAAAFAAALACAALMSGSEAKSGDATKDGAGTAAIYGNIPPDQIEFLSTPDRIKSVAASGAPTAIWETLEHGEKVECLDCIPTVEPLLYDSNAKTREIAAWWLRRRVFGVFGPGEVYERTLGALKSDPDPRKRAFAAYALGEFLATPGIEACANAVIADRDATVRAAAASALGRLNDDGSGALGKAMLDADGRVKIAAMGAASRINQFADSASVVRALGDGDDHVRRRAIELLDGMRAADSVATVMSLAKNDPKAEVRAAACHALGAFRDGSARSLLEDLAQHDTDTFVRDQAQIALRRL
jgi:HEAT repeat protein